MLRKVLLFYGFLGIVVLETTVMAMSVVLGVSAWQAIESVIPKASSTSLSAVIIGVWGILFQVALLVGMIALRVVVPIAFWRNFVRPRRPGPQEEAHGPRPPDGEAQIDA